MPTRPDLSAPLGKRGVLRTMLLMWWLRLRYLLGASPARLLRLYEDTRR